jgi:hypothetical protein
MKQSLKIQECWNRTDWFAIGLKDVFSCTIVELV